MQTASLAPDSAVKSVLSRNQSSFADGGYAWVDVMQTTESKQRPFDEVKNEVKTLWSDNKKRKALSELAKKFADRLKAGEDFAKVAQEAGGTVRIHRCGGPFDNP